MGLLSSVFSNYRSAGPIDIANVLQTFANYNARKGAPLAARTARQQNQESLQGAYSDIEAGNNAALENILEQMGLYNRGASEFSTDRAAEINTEAANRSSQQALDWNQAIAQVLGETTRRVNQDTGRYGAESATQMAGVLDPYAAQQAANLNNNVALPAANQAASRFNQSATDDVLNVMADMFGGAEQFDRFQNQINQNLEDKLAGRVSQSTRRQLARNAIASGNTELGSGATQDSYTGYLGLTSEQLQAQGQQQYQSLYGLYRQSVPITSGAQLLPQYGVSASQISSQATGLASQQFGANAVSAQQLTGMSGLNNQQLLQLQGLSNAQLYNTNAINAGQVYGSNSINANNYFQTNALPAQSMLGLTTLSPAQAIAFEFQNEQAARDAAAERDNRRIDNQAMRFLGGGGGGIGQDTRQMGQLAPRAPSPWAQGSTNYAGVGMASMMGAALGGPVGAAMGMATGISGARF